MACFGPSPAPQTPRGPIQTGDGLEVIGLHLRHCHSSVQAFTPGNAYAYGRGTRTPSSSSANANRSAQRTAGRATRSPGARTADVAEEAACRLRLEQNCHSTRADTSGPRSRGLIFTRSVQTCGFERRVPPSLTQLPSLQTEVTMATRKDVRGHRGKRVCPGRAGLPVLSVATAAF